MSILEAVLLEIIGAEVLFSDKVMNKINEKLSSEVVSKFSIRGRKEKIDLHKISV